MLGDFWARRRAACKIVSHLRNVIVRNVKVGSLSHVEGHWLSWFPNKLGDVSRENLEITATRVDQHRKNHHASLIGRDLIEC